ncbi:Agmatine deiminase [Flavobacterium sp. 9R]|uniref:agmatine deiminase family protein n=1 Tax=Flavobacterium sp. 9R TaxID=2653143 RepID=UPI0012F0B0E8|nr:agmatine deiminase family protein [Flavobacterium sp. 9R]VXC02330.1 Agmatine deiminase [Flavobacterium sp. 9R]
MKKLFTIVILSPLFLSCQEESELTTSEEPISTEILYTMPDESEPHEGTWLQWPHQYQYGIEYRNELDDTWIAMTKSLIKSEKVHIIAYDANEKSRILFLLEKAEVSVANIDFTIQKTDDVWVRDNGPIYVRNKNKELVIQDWGFNGWGKKTDYNNCNIIPNRIAKDQQLQIIDLNSVMINEGGAVEIDGQGTLMATKSAILNSNRNPGMSQSQAEVIFTKYLGVTNFIWLDGKAGKDITDMHIDGFARFGNKSTIVTMAEDDLLYWEVPEKDIQTLYKAVSKNGKNYTFLKLPLTKNDVVTATGKKLKYKGSYVNYYIANSVILVPNYNDPNDAIANTTIQTLYPNRKVVGIDVRNLYANGGMVHCVTQQQPRKEQ